MPKHKPAPDYVEKGSSALLNKKAIATTTNPIEHRFTIGELSRELDLSRARIIQLLLKDSIKLDILGNPEVIINGNADQFYLLIDR